MATRIAVVNGNNDERAELCATLRLHLFEAVGFPSLADFEQVEKEFEAVIFDLQSLPVSNRLLSRYRRILPGLQMIVISNRYFHPELKESMATCISACLKKPVDVEELVYLLKGYER